MRSRKPGRAFIVVRSGSADFVSGDCARVGPVAGFWGLRADAILAELRGTKTPGAAVVAVKDGRVVFAKGFGAELPVTKIGSGSFSVSPAPNAAPPEFTIERDASGRAEALRMFSRAVKKSKVE